MLRARLLVVVAASLFACNKEEAAPAPAAPPTAAANAASADTAPKAAPPATTAEPAPAPATPAAPPPTDKTFTHSKLGFSLSYPDSLTAKEDAKGVTLTGAPLGKLTVDRSDKSRGPEDVALSMRITIEDGALVAVAKKTNPSFGEAFPKGSEAAFKESKDYSEKVIVGSATGYSFTMGSHGSNEQDTFVPARTGKTAVVRCRYFGVADAKLTEDDQLAICGKVTTSLKF